MTPFSFKKIKFFHSKETPVRKAKNNGSSIENKEASSFWKKLINNPFFYLIIFSAAIAYLISYLPSKSLPQLSVGDIAPTDITAPSDLTIIDEDTFIKRQQEAVDAVVPVYTLDQNVFLKTEDKIRDFFKTGREFSQEETTAKKIDEFTRIVSETYGVKIPPKDLRFLTQLKFPASLEENLINLIGKVSSKGILLTKDLFLHDEQNKGLVIFINSEKEIAYQVSDIQDVKESKIKLSEEINTLELPQNEKSLLILLSHLFVSSNITFSPFKTSEHEESARQNIETIFYTIKKGKVIIRKGDEVNKDTIKQVSIINQNLSAKPSWLINFSGFFLLFIILLGVLLYDLETRSGVEEPLKKFIMTGILLAISLILYKFFNFLAGLLSQNTRMSFFSHTESYMYLLPLQMGTLLIAFLSGTLFALIFTIINSIIVGYLLKSSFHIILFCTIGSLAAIFGTKYFGKQSRTTTFRAALFMVAPVNTLLIIIFHLVKEKIGPIDLFISEFIMALIGGLISGALAFLLLPLFESLFGIITQSHLLELTNSDLPIFRKMAMEAPGSYHHSLIVSSLAENAAEDIGLDPLLVKAGALYHDIGKIKRPEYFIENRRRNADMHKDLKPSMSTLVIINHVKEGVERARKLKLPKKIRDIIEQHHGNSLVRYFFEKAKEEYDPEMNKIGEESYRYAGPTPKSKEAALVMLSDSIEAASRSIKSPTKSILKRAITEIFNNYLQDGQLDDSNLSLKEMKSIAESFLSTLYTIYHHRIEYPGFDFEGKKNKMGKPKTKNDRNSKPAKKTQNK
jgi:putative nucleotidyltransferase with HDIG domain